MAERKRRVRLGAVAELDFANIVKWTTENFGARQSRVCQKTLVQAIGELAKRRIGGARFDPIRAAARLRSGPGALTQFPPGPSCKLARIGEGRSRRAHWVVAVSGGPQTLSEATATLILRFGGTGMKKLCIGVVAVVLIICGPALAADMPAKAPVYKAAPPASFAWTGCYVGGNVGGGWARTSYRIDDPATAPFDGTSLGSNTGSGIVGGGQIGCDYQVASWVFGVQGLFDGADIKGSHHDPLNSFPVDWTSKISWLTTATGRVGYTVVPQALLYAKGGAAWVKVHDDRSGPNPFAPPAIFSQATPDRTVNGWTVGAGLEYLLAPNWSVFAEYNYIDLGTTKPTFIRNTDQATLFVDVRREVHAVWIGLNYRFGSLVSAKY